MPMVMTFRRLVSPHYRRIHNQDKLYRDFARRWLSIASWNKIEDVEKDFSLFVTGSDQVWSPIATPLTEEYIKDYSHYFLQFTRKKKISYAPSIKLDDDSGQVADVIKPWLDSYSHISVREAYGAQALERILGRKVFVALDPTLLITGSEWRELISDGLDADCGSGYISCYFIRYNPAYINLVVQLASALNLKVRVMTPRSEYVGTGYEIITAGPEQYLREINGCRYFFSDSFHGTVFATLFHKPFFTFENEERGAVNGRISNLLSKVGIPERLIVASVTAQIDVRELEAIDYASVDNLLAKERQQSLDWLKNAIEN